MSCDVGHSCGSDPTLLWLWCGPAATGPIQPLTWKPPYAEGVALKKTNKKSGTSNIKVNAAHLTSRTNSGKAPHTHTPLGRGNTQIIKNNNVVVDDYYSSVAVIPIVNMS